MFRDLKGFKGIQREWKGIEGVFKDLKGFQDISMFLMDFQVFKGDEGISRDFKIL